MYFAAHVEAILYKKKNEKKKNRKLRPQEEAFIVNVHVAMLL